MADTLNIGTTAVAVVADNKARVRVRVSGGTVYYGVATVSSSSNDGNVTDGNTVDLNQTKYFVSASSSQLVITPLADVAAEDISVVDDLTVAGDLAVTGTTVLTGAQTLTGATLHSAGITGTHADGLVLSANGGKDTLALSNTTADVGITIGADTNLYRSAANTLKTDDALVAASTLAVTSTTALTGAVTTTGGVVGLGVSPRIAASRQVSSLTFGTDKTPVVTETAIVEVVVPSNVTLTGVEVLIGSVGGTDKFIVALYDSAGAVVANSALAGVTVGTTATWQQVPFTATYAAKGPGLYFIGLQVNGTTARYRTIPVGPRMATAVKTSEVFGTLTTITPPTTFTADIGPVTNTY